ncbi:MAG: MFS transporter [Geminicoccaceae bacterium]
MSEGGDRFTGSAWSPLRLPVYRALWIATLVSNIGTWIHDVSAGWLMTSLATSPMLVALVQAATTLPAFLLALPAGALADLVDRRRLLIGLQLAMGITATLLALCTIAGFTTPGILLAATFVMGVGSATSAPAYQAIVPGLVPKSELSAAITLNGVGINLARAIGPAVGGVLVTLLGAGWSFLLNAASFLAVIAALVSWRPAPAAAGALPAERFMGAMRAGLRYAKASPPFRLTVARSCLFFIPASAIWALLPLLVRRDLGLGPGSYGLVLTAVGAGALAGAFLLPKLKDRLDGDAKLLWGQVLIGLALIVFALVHDLPSVMAAGLGAGLGWIAVLPTLSLAAQSALPDWVRARGLSLFLMAMMGSLTAGSLIWGQLASQTSVRTTLLVAAVLAVAGALVGRRLRVGGTGDLDLSPSQHWADPVLAHADADTRGPVIVTVEYRVAEGATPGFVAALDDLGRERRRDGAVSWGLFEDAADPGRWLEHFVEESWLDHRRHHARVTRGDAEIQARIRDLLRPGTEPIVTHWLAPSRRTA